MFFDVSLGESSTLECNSVSSMVDGSEVKDDLSAGFTGERGAGGGGGGFRQIEPSWVFVLPSNKRLFRLCSKHADFTF